MMKERERSAHLITCFFQLSFLSSNIAFSLSMMLSMSLMGETVFSLSLYQCITVPVLYCTVPGCTSGLALGLPSPCSACSAPV